MQPLIALFNLVTEIAIRQKALIAALERKGLLTTGELNAELPSAEQESLTAYNEQKEKFLSYWQQVEDLLKLP